MVRRRERLLATLATVLGVACGSAEGTSRQARGGQGGEGLAGVGTGGGAYAVEGGAAGATSSTASGGKGASAGSPGAGGVTASAGSIGTGGATASAGTPGTGGVTASAGSIGTGGVTASAGTPGTGGATESAGASGTTGGATAISAGIPLIVVDQFGYRPGTEKIAVIRDPRVGFDSASSFEPSDDYAVVDVASGEAVFTGSPVIWNGGAIDASSGDVAWWFDFSVFDIPGTYFVQDLAGNVRSPQFEISPTVYGRVLAQAMRAFFYQRAGFDKSAAYAGIGWADGASHVGPLQDANCRLFSAPDDAATERDLHGGWYDAGDYNRYTAWHARYVIELLRAYRNAPAAFSDDYGIPESGNGVPDVIDEVLFGMDWLERMQEDDGSLLSIVGVGHASPPSAAAEPSFYGSPSTTATLAGAAAFALGARVFDDLGEIAYSNVLRTRAESAWAWATQNPDRLFRNNDAAEGTAGLGAGQQEVDDDGRFAKRFEAAVHLFAATGDTTYSGFVDDNYSQIHLMAWDFVYPFEMPEQESLLEYAALPDATPAVASEIRATYGAALDGDSNLGAHRSAADPYLAYLQDYVWGSNSTKANQGLIFTDVVDYGVDEALDEEALRLAERYVHYLHGVNPLGLVYLSNMEDFGAEKSVTEFYHSWFADGSTAWDSTLTSTFGPPPGFLTGGPNPSYTVDGCCPSGCGSPENDALCAAEPTEPPSGQPPQKAYKQFNTAWPLNSWAVTENSNGYQVAYIRLLAKFVQ